MEMFVSSPNNPRNTSIQLSNWNSGFDFFFFALRDRRATEAPWQKCVEISPYPVLVVCAEIQVLCD